MFSQWKATDIEYFFNEEQGVLGIDGEKKKDPKVRYIYNIYDMN